MPRVALVHQLVADLPGADEDPRDRVAVDVGAVVEHELERAGAELFSGRSCLRHAEVALGREAHEWHALRRDRLASERMEVLRGGGRVHHP